MAAPAVCGTKRNYLFDDEHLSYPNQKKLRLYFPSGNDGLMNSPKIPANGSEWVEFFVREMSSATTMDDARSRAARAVEALEQAVVERVGEEVSRRYEEESAAAKEKMDALGKENAVLKRAVGIQQQRLEEKEKELQLYKEAASQSQENVRILEMKNYSLAMHLNQALGGGDSLTGNGNRHVF